MSEPLATTEVWLTSAFGEIDIEISYQRGKDVTIVGTAKSVSMRGAQKEVTTDLTRAGWTPVGRWEQVETGEAWKSHRVFRPGRDAQPLVPLRTK